MKKPLEILDKMEHVITSKKLNYFDIIIYDGSEWHSRELLAVSSCQNCYSVSKAFTATAIGIAQDMDLLSVDDTLDGFFNGEWPVNHDLEMKNVKIRHLLTHTMGLDAGYLFEADRYDINADNWLEYCLSKPLKDKPGEKFTYSNSTYYLLSCIISRVSGMKMDRFLCKHLFKPLSIHNFAWAACPMGETQGGTSLYLSTKDMAKLGVLYMNKGIWDGKRVLSEDWVVEATKNHTAHIPGTKYGFGMGIMDKGYQFAGAHNQYVVIKPDMNMVIAAHGYIDNMDIAGIFNSVMS